ncbi:MAG: hypothetical protein M3Y87_21365 [Myxococcota bacterium]|nr:hypothetical protein [Myxococcota bacterium]
MNVRRMFLALTLGATVAVIVGALGASISSSLVGRSAESALSVSRTLAAFAGLAAMGTYLLAGLGRRHTALALMGIAGAIVVAWLAWMAARAPHRAPMVLLESDRAGLEEVVIDGERWVAHEGLGFRLPQPSVALAPSEAIVRETLAVAMPGWAEAHELWAFESPDRALTVTIDLTRADDVDVASLRRVLEGATGPLRAAGHDVETSAPVIARGGCGSARFGADLPNEGRVEGRVLAFEEPRSHRAFLLTITIVGPAGAQARDYLDEVVVPCGDGD